VEAGGVEPPSELKMRCKINKLCVEEKTKCLLNACFLVSIHITRSKMNSCQIQEYGTNY
jgi:hypothetical protein